MTRSEKTMLILIESGLVYFLFFVRTLFPSLNSTPLMSNQLAFAILGDNRILQKISNDQTKTFAFMINQYMCSHILVSFSLTLNFTRS